MSDGPYSIATGYYGVPGSSRGNFTVHAVKTGKPLCGWRPRKEMQFQWCAWGIQYHMLECDRCKEIARKFWTSRKTG